MSEITAEERVVKQHNNYKGEIYFNGFEVGFSNSDASIQLRSNSETVADLNLSFGTLKTLANYLTDLVEDIESMTAPILSISEFKNKMKESTKEESKEENEHNS